MRKLIYSTVDTFVDWKKVINMDDQGEKIVFLARALLNANAAETPIEHKPLSVTMTFRALCLTTMLAAGGSAIATAWVHESERPLNRYERFEIQALVFYAAKLKGIDEKALCGDIEQKFNISSLDGMTAGDFLAARRYLQEKAH